MSRKIENGTEVMAEDELGRERPGIVTTQTADMRGKVDGLIVRFTDDENGFITVPYGYIDTENFDNSVVRPK